MAFHVTTSNARVVHVLPKNDPFPIESRIRAAMTFADMGFRELAQAINTPNLGERTLRNIATPTFTRRTAGRLDLIAISKATGLPYEFFTLPAAAFVQALASAGDADTEADAAHEESVDEAPTTEIDDLRSQVADLAEAVLALSSGDAETALRAARSAAERAPRETAQDAASRRRHLAPAPTADQEAR